MKVISVNTKIAALIKENPKAIDAIASINAHFKKLQNPFLRRFLAPRVTIAEAAKIGRCEPEAFFERLKPLGFIIDYGAANKHNETRYMQETNTNHTAMLDVRADIASGNDPFRKIMSAVSELEVGETLLLINSFEPIPLIRILEQKQFEVSIRTINEDEVHTYITRTQTSKVIPVSDSVNEELFEQKMKEYHGNMAIIDVRALPMPLPMVKILETLSCIEKGMALFVYHKKVPMFLFPELKERNYGHALRRTDNGVELIIYRKEEGNETT